MPKGVDIVVINGDGDIAPEGNEARYRLRSSEGRFRIMSDSPGLIVLRRMLPSEELTDDDTELSALDDFFSEDETGPMGVTEELTEAPHVILAGEILSPMTLFQMVEIVAERGFHGDMHVFGSAGRHFMLALDQGALLYARSNHPDDRLGELMVREQLIDRDWLDVLLGDVSGNHRLGDVCLERGVLDRKQLFSLLHKQTSEIFLRMLLVGDGSYIFTTPDAEQGPPDHTVHIQVRALLMDGIRRLDEIELYRQLIPGSDVVLRVRDVVDPTDLDEDAQALLPFCDGQAPLSEVARRANLDEFASTRGAYFLVKRRAAEVVAREQFDEGEVERVTNAFSEILRDVFAAVDAEGGLESARGMLSAWVDGSGYTSYLGERVGTDGTIDTEVVLDAMRSAREEDPLATLHHVGHELVSFALFCAGSALPRDKEIPLSKDVNRRLKEIRTG